MEKPRNVPYADLEYGGGGLCGDLDALSIDNIAWSIRNVMAEKISHFHISYKTDPLAILLLSGRQVEPFSYFPDFGFEHFSKGEKCMLCQVLLYQIK